MNTETLIKHVNDEDIDSFKTDFTKVIIDKIRNNFNSFVGKVKEKEE